MFRPATAMRFAVALCFLSIALWLSGAAQRARTGAVRMGWPQQHGVYVASSSQAIPRFPDALRGYRSEDDKDFWRKPFLSRGTIRIFQGGDWAGIPEFPVSMNGCNAGVFMVRWRSADPGIPVQTSVRYSSRTPGATKTGEFGYMSGTNCAQPMFKFGDTLDPYRYPPIVRGQRVTYLVDIYYELKFWQAAP